MTEAPLSKKAYLLQLDNTRMWWRLQVALAWKYGSTDENWKNWDENVKKKKKNKKKTHDRFKESCLCFFFMFKIRITAHSPEITEQRLLLIDYLEFHAQHFKCYNSRF